MSYDTTFQLGDFYVSTLLFKNVLFQKSPVMPALFMIHEKKLKSCHEELMKVAAVELSCLTYLRYVFVIAITMLFFLTIVSSPEILRTQVTHQPICPAYSDGNDEMISESSALWFSNILYT